LLSLGALLGTANVLQAQERTTGTITGELKDASGGVLPGATVVVTNMTSGRVYTFVTDGAGVYRAEVDPGTYTVRYEMSGFSRQETPNILVESGKTLTLNASLKVGNLTEAVQVTAESAPLIDTRGTMISHNVTAEQFDKLPKTRSFQSMAATSPSVNEGVVEGGIQVNGASGAENLYTVDGVITNSLINGSSRANTVFEYLQEVQVKTTGISAEYGGALGGVISAVTKSGGNTMHGEGHWYFDGSPLQAKPVKRLVMNPTTLTDVAYFQDPKPDDIRNEVGGSIGGPIMRDHLWYFGSYSPKFVRRTNTYKFSSGTEEGTIPRDQDITQAFGKVSYGSRILNAYGTVLYTPLKQTGTIPAYNGYGENFLTSTKAANESRITQGYDQNQFNTTENVDFLLNSSSVLTVRGGLFRDRFEDTGVPTTTSWQYQSPCCPAGVPGNVSPGPFQFQNVAPVQISVFDTTKQGFVNADYTQNFRAGGLHALKGGVGVRHTVNDVRKAYPGGKVSVYWDQPASLPNGSTPSGKYGYYTVEDIGTIGTAGANMIGVYVQDQWQATDRLTLNLGIRTEDEKLPTFRPDILKYAFHFHMKDKLAPRLSAAYDINGDGRSKVFASWGRYFDFTKYELARGSFGGDSWRTYYRAIDDANVAAFQTAHIGPNGECAECAGTDIWQVPGGFQDKRIPDFSGLDPDIKPMSQDSFNAGYERQLAPTSVVRFGYTHNHLNRTIEDIGSLVAGSETYIYGNPGEGRATLTPTNGLTKPFPTPTAKRVYDAVNVEWERRFANRWFASANYTWSRLWGNYSGIANSDEIRTPTTGVSFATDQQNVGNTARAGGNETRAWDLDHLLWDAHGNLDVTGLLPTDRPHVFKAFGSYSAPFGTTFGLVQYVGSGTPVSTTVEDSNLTYPYVNGRGDLGRTPVLTRTDALVSHEVHMGGRSVRAEFNVINLFNQKTTRHIFSNLNRYRRTGSEINLTTTDLAKGYDYLALMNATADAATTTGAKDPRFGMADLFSDGFTGQFTLKFIF